MRRDCTRYTKGYVKAINMRTKARSTEEIKPSGYQKRAEKLEALDCCFGLVLTHQHRIASRRDLSNHIRNVR